MSFFTHTLSRLRKEDHGFSLMETVVALGVLFIALLALARTAAVGFTDIALSRQRTQANQIANKVLEQVRGLSYERVGEGLDTDDLTGDPNIITTCPDGAYYRVCPGTNPEAEKLVHSADPSPDAPLVPHRTTFGAADGYTNNYTASVYVTHAKAVPQTGAYRVTVAVTWTPAARPGLSSAVTSQSLLYTPEGTTDATTGGGTAPFFYGTGSIGRAPVTITPMAGVTGGTGLTGLPSWDSITEDLYGLEASLQEQTLARAESKAVMTGARKVVAGVETASGGDAAEAVADNDPATTTGPSSAPPGLMQSAVSAEISGGGNALQVEAASGSSVECPPGQITPVWMTGMELGRVTNAGNGLFYEIVGPVTADTTVVRNGTYSLKTAPAGSGGYVDQIVNQVPRIVMSFAIRFDALPTTNITELAAAYTVTSGIHMRLGYDLSGNKLKIALNGGSPVFASSTLAAGQWYVIDMKYDTSTGTHAADWRINGVDQPAASVGSAATNMYFFLLGTSFAGVYASYFDDIVVSQTTADYPIGDGKILPLKPNAMGTHSGSSNFQNDNNTAIDATTWSRLDEVPINSTADFVKQVTASGTSYVEVNFEDTAETCIRGVTARMAYYPQDVPQANNGKTSIFDGSTETVVYSGGMTERSTVVFTKRAIVPPATSPWSQSAVNGLKARIGYSTDASPNPRWDALLLEYFVPGIVVEGGAGTETGSTASTTAASSGTPCGNPTQLDGRACSYAREDYSTSGPPHLSARLDLTGSGAGKAKIYKFQPTTQAGSTSYVWGRRTAGGGGAGTVKETVVRYPGTHELGALPAALGSGPTGWQGYWVKYDAGSTATSVSAEAGIGSAAPTITSAGTISYWNGSGYSTMTPPTDGSAPVIPAVPVSHSSGGFRVEICPAPDPCSLAVSPSSTSQVPAGASGTTTRTEARATLGSPMSGTFTYKVSNTSSGAVIAYVTVAVDLGSLSATARYAP